MFHNKRLLSGYIDNQLNESEKIKLEKHLKKCRGCFFELENIKKLKSSIAHFAEHEKIPEVFIRKLLLPTSRSPLPVVPVPVYETLAYKFGIAFFLNAFMLKFDSFSNTWVAILGSYALFHLVIYLKRFCVVKQLGLV
ncbi:MAG: zf-HC2 domain-containing protein [Elusimicrobiota bacterium]